MLDIKGILAGFTKGDGGCGGFRTVKKKCMQIPGAVAAASLSSDPHTLESQG